VIARTAFEQLGLVAHILTHCQEYASRTAKNLNVWVAPAIMHRQIHFVFDTGGIPIGFWTWAFLGSDVEQRLSRNTEGALHESEWNEGEALWIIDFVAPYGYVRDIVTFMRLEFFRGIDEVKGRRKLRDGSGYRILKRRGSKDGNYEEYRQSSHRYRLHRTAYASSYTEWVNNKDRPSTAF